MIEQPQFELAEKLNVQLPNNSTNKYAFTTNVNFLRLLQILKIEKRNNFEAFDFNYSEFNGSGKNKILNPIINDGELMNFSGKASTRQDALSVNREFIRYDCEINLLEDKIVYNMEGYFLDYEFDNSEEKLAFKISCDSFENAKEIFLFVGFGDISESEAIKNYTINVFNKTFLKNRNNPEKLNLLYSSVPSFVLEQRLDQALWEDLQALLKYDKQTNWFIDTSSAINNLLLGFTNPEALYNRLFVESELVISLYRNMKPEGKEQFCQLLMLLSYFFASEVQQTHVTIPIGKIYTLDSDLFLGRKDEVFLKVTRPDLDSLSVTSTGIPSSGINSDNPAGSNTPFNLKVDSTTVIQQYFNPLDVVSLKTTEGEILVPALYVKRLSDKKEWKELVEVTTSVINVASIFLSGWGLAAGATGLIRVAALADIVVSTADEIRKYSGIEKVLEKTEEGRWMLNHWDLISFGLSAGTITAQLAEGLIKNGPNAIRSLQAIKAGARATALKFAEQIDAFIARITVELYITGLSKLISIRFEPLGTLWQLLGSRFADNMKSVGLVLSKEIDGQDYRVLLYQGKIIAEGDLKTIKKQLKQLFKPPIGAKNYIKRLDDIVLQNLLNDFISIRVRLAKLDVNALNRLWLKNIDVRELQRSQLTQLRNKYVKLHPVLSTMNFAEFDTKIFKNSKLAETVKEFSHSKLKTDGSNKIAEVVEGRKVLDQINNQKFIKNVEDLKGVPRKNDSEFKYIYQFLTTHITKGDFFVVETTNIMTACSSCRRELLVLKELMGGKLKIVVKAKEELERVKQVDEYLK